MCCLIFCSWRQKWEIPRLPARCWFIHMFSLFPLHLSLILLNSRGKDLGVTRSYWSFPRKFIPPWVREQDKNGQSCGISWLCVSSRNKFFAFVLWSCCLFKTTLSFAEYTGIRCFATWIACPKNVLMMWWPLVFWVQCLFNVGLKSGHPSSQVLLLSVTQWHHVFSSWCHPCTVTAHHMQTSIYFSGPQLYENVFFFFILALLGTTKIWGKRI